MSNKHAADDRKRVDFQLRKGRFRETICKSIDGQIINDESFDAEISTIRRGEVQ